MMTESDQTYYYASPDGQAAGPVSKRELRRLLEQGAIRESTSVLRKGENQWRRLSDFLPPRKDPATPATPDGASRADQAASIYYYASPNGQATGPVSERELRRLLEQDVIHQSTNVFRKGDTQWRRLGDILPIQALSDSSASPERNKKIHALAKGEMRRQCLSILIDTYVICLKNFLSVFLAVILWILTIWIPYIHIGTTIAICNLPVDLAKGKLISPTCIFARRYRQFFGEFFILNYLIVFGITFGLFLFIFPGIVLTYSWLLAPILLLDKGVNPMEALTLSNKYMYGNKFFYFLTSIVLLASFGALCGLLHLITGLGAIVLLLAPVIGISFLAATYKKLVLSQDGNA